MQNLSLMKNVREINLHTLQNLQKVDLYPIHVLYSHTYYITSTSNMHKGEQIGTMIFVFFHPFFIFYFFYLFFMVCVVVEYKACFPSSATAIDGDFIGTTFLSNIVARMLIASQANGAKG